MKVAFIVPPNVELLDSPTRSGFYRSQNVWICCRHWVLRLYGWNNRLQALIWQGCKLQRGSVEGGDFRSSPVWIMIILQVNLPGRTGYFSWIGNVVKIGYHCSICNGAFVLASRLLDGQECTTHWSGWCLTSSIPKARVVRIRYMSKAEDLYQRRDQRGIDLALGILESWRAPVVHKVARGLVVYHRRAQSHSQQSIYLISEITLSQNSRSAGFPRNNIAGENSIESLHQALPWAPEISVGYSKKRQARPLSSTSRDCDSKMLERCWITLSTRLIP